MQVTDHFRAEEFAQKSKHGIHSMDYPGEWIEDRLLPLCRQLEALRGFVNQPIRIISGYRSEAYNRAIGGARHSQHVQGRAADIVIPGITAAGVHRIIKKLVAAGEMQLGGLGKYQGFVHVDIRPSDRLVQWEGKRTAKQTEA